MERPLTLNPLSIQDENSVVHRKKVTVDGKSKTSRPLANKGGVALESRKALNDITNKPSKANSQCKKQSNVVENGFLQQHVFESKKKVSLNEKLNIVEEGFLHDHSKCIDAQKAATASSELNFWDTVLPGHDSTNLIMERAKGDAADNCCPKLEELPMSEFSEWFECCGKSPPPSPVHGDHPLPSPSAWEFELGLKEDDYGDV
ncbi:hypothetical protein C2S51_023334 [Perilla frutescens var. frutescens]|nr:hypothetical protein C2S51_023334 [Perilla frutescens var. frutescens]